MRWNPFSHLRETKKYSTGRLLLSGIGRRIEDTFRVFYGDVFNTDENELGILDYLFPLPRISQNILYVAYSNTAALILAAIPAVPLMAIKFIAASVLTFISLPFVGFTHLFVMPTINKLSNRIQHLKITSVESEENEDNPNVKNEEKELGQVFSTEKMRSLLVIPVEKDEYDESNYTLASKHRTDKLLLGLFEGTWKLGENPIHVNKRPKAIIEITPENKKGIKALLKTNMFKTTTYLEDEELLGVLEEKLHAKKA